jgi:AcrR family transcriptional regulator
VSELILDSAAALFARHGGAHTSIQAIADSVGLSKAGLLHHYPSKDALRAAVVSQVRTLGQQTLQAVVHLPVGAARDQRALEVLLEIALAHPGVVSLLLSPVTQAGTEDPELNLGNQWAFAAFGVDPETGDRERVVRVGGALAALAVLSLGAVQAGYATEDRPHILATSFDALGHRRPCATSSSFEQVET